MDKVYTYTKLAEQCILHRSKEVDGNEFLIPKSTMIDILGITYDPEQSLKTLGNKVGLINGRDYKDDMYTFMSLLACFLMSRTEYATDTTIDVITNLVYNVLYATN